MSDKYIIRNCPNITFIDLWRLEPKSSYCKLKNCGCENYTDCLLKKIVELAKGYKDELIDRKTKKVVATRYFKLTKEILELLDIEECE